MSGSLSSDRGLMAEINVTSLVDITIVLLIMFMIIAPIAQGGVEVRIPEAESTPLPSSEAVIVAIDGAGKVYVDQTEVRPEAVGDVLAQVRTSRGLRRVYLRADRDIPYGSVAEVMGRLQAAGFENVGLVMDAPAPESR